MKTCTKCNIKKPLDDFRSDRNKSDGLHPHCKSCKIIYNESKKGRESHRNCIARYANNYPNRVKAIQNARNVVVPALCECCIKELCKEKHHESYLESHWKDVIGLCEDCHDAVHRMDNGLDRDTRVLDIDSYKDEVLERLRDYLNLP